MDWLQRINSAMDYIEDNLSNEIDFKEAAKLACCSTYHFPRMFSAMTGILLSEYIRRRRLSLAALELQNSNIKVIDLALKYGYDSPDSFARAFQKLHGVTPTAARENGVQLRAFPRMSFQISIKGDVEMEYRIEELNAFTVVGIKETVVTKKAFRTIPTLWRNANKSGFMQRLIDMSWKNPQCRLESLLGICGEEAAIMDEEFVYFMAVRYEKEPPTDMEKLIIPQSTWVVFPNVVEAWQRLYTEWVPTSGYELANLPCIECYYPPKHKPRHELWVPIIKA